MTFDVDLFVIGGGSGGVRAARVAAETGARVMLAEEDRMGGTCVIRGCVPKKLMVFASGYAQSAREAADYGWQIQMGGLDWGKFHARLTGELDRLEGIYTANLKKAGVDIVPERASVADPHTVELASGRRVTAKHILVATGGRPFKPPETPGIKHAIMSDDVFQLTDLPKRLLIVGGGYIACEFACIFHGMGSEVTQFYRGAQILRGFDDECRGHLAELIRGRGIDLRLGTDVQWIERRDDGLRVKASDGMEATFDQVLYATGRKPNSGGMGLAEAGVKLGRWGQVEVDRFSQTSVPSIYAVGDVTDRVNLTPVAIREGAAFVANDLELSPEGEGAAIWLVTGPNMAGKSTYLRQNALIAALAQMGSHVPARAAHIGLVSQIFSRVGASDDLARGRSTFMVEMVETAAILNQADDRAFVILDEIGRGTATWDGLSIAWAVLEHLHAANRCRALFATHYHEMTALSAKLPGLTNATVAVREWEGEVIFLHEVRRGAADRSYGVQVARLAGLPEAVVARAREILARLEAGEAGRPGAAELIDDLPLVRIQSPAPPPAPTAKPSAVEARLRDIQPDSLTPRDALALLYDLKALLPPE